jgi:hypothetical protein
MSTPWAAEKCRPVFYLTPRRIRLRADARGRDGGVCEERAAEVKGVDGLADGSIQNDSGLPQGPAGPFRCILSLL